MDRKEYENERFGLSFTLPTSLTAREHLRFRERLFVTMGDEDTYSRYWQAALPLIEDWECELVPDPEAVDLDTETRREAADLIFYVSTTVAGHMHTMDDVPKNS